MKSLGAISVLRYGNENGLELVKKQSLKTNGSRIIMLEDRTI